METADGGETMIEPEGDLPTSKLRGFSVVKEDRPRYRCA
jgi:hypothetical protein